MDKVPKFVTTEWLAERLNDPDLRLFDATTILTLPSEDAEIKNGKEAYDRGHIPGAVYADLYRELSDSSGGNSFAHPTREQFVEKISELGVGEGTYVVVYDQVNPIWSSRLAWQLKYEGFDNVAILDGGFQKWIKENRPVSTEPGSYQKGSFIGERRPELFVTKEAVLEAIDDEETIIIDTLTKESYRGDVNVYGRRGHIPGSINISYDSFTDPETNKLHDKEMLRKIFEGTGALDPEKKVITYCGSGIHATWDATLLNVLGQENVSVYDGSLVEWAKDETLPMETGD